MGWSLLLLWVVAAEQRILNMQALKDIFIRCSQGTSMNYLRKIHTYILRLFKLFQLIHLFANPWSCLPVIMLRVVWHLGLHQICCGRKSSDMAQLSDSSCRVHRPNECAGTPNGPTPARWMHDVSVTAGYQNPHNLLCRVWTENLTWTRGETDAATGTFISDINWTCLKGDWLH